MMADQNEKSIYSYDPIVHEDEIILSYLRSFAYTIKLWVSNKQEERITETIDKFGCILTAYMHGLKGEKEGLMTKEEVICFDYIKRELEITRGLILKLIQKIR